MWRNDADATGVRQKGRSSGDLQRLLQEKRTSIPPSAWLTDSATPMTSRPHFEGRPSSPMRRTRSRSLGSAAERQLLSRAYPSMEYPKHFHDWRDYLLSSPTPEASVSTMPTSLTHLPELPLTTSTMTAEPAVSTFLPPQQPLKKEASPALEANCHPSPTHVHYHTEGNPAWLSVMYGLINATIILPVLMSFAAIIFRNEAFSAAMPALVKLTLVSGMIHQVCFSTFSSLPFAVGQVQDAGLIFLSSMASNIVDYCRANNHDMETLLATATITIPLATAVLGVALIFLGRWKLAQYVQLLPTSVVGGYLAYIGWFCGLAGVGLMAGASEITISLVTDKWHLIAPGVLSGLLLYVCVRTLKHMAVLPCSIMFLLILFYFVVWMRGASVAQVTEEGWIRKLDDTTLSWLHTWDMLKFDKVAWGVLPSLLMTEMSMIFVVALSSSLDVAAIELELKRPLDYNHELQTVGLSNLVSGLTGGYTGSYIFSQSIFTLRAGIRSRLAGYVLAGCQLVIFLLPIPILAYVPNFFFGSLLSLICFDLTYEWLWEVRDKVTPVEYVICLSTFGLIQWAGVEYGILLGVALYLALRQVGLDVGNTTDGSSSEDAQALVSIQAKEGPRDGLHAEYGTLGLPT